MLTVLLLIVFDPPNRRLSTPRLAATLAEAALVIILMVALLLLFSSRVRTKLGPLAPISASRLVPGAVAGRWGGSAGAALVLIGVLAVNAVFTDRINVFDSLGLSLNSGVFSSKSLSKLPANCPSLKVCRSSLAISFCVKTYCSIPELCPMIFLMVK